MRTLAPAALAAAGLVLAAAALGRLPLPGPVRAAGMLALPLALLGALRRGHRRLDGAVDAIGSGKVGPSLRHLLLGQRRKLDEALHR